MKLKWTLPDGTRCTVRPVQLLDTYSAEGCYVKPGEIHNLPKPWSSLDWHLVEQSPCLWGDDLRIAVDTERGLGYVIHDMNCQAFPWEYSLEYFVLRHSEDPPIDDEDDPFHAEADAWSETGDA